ncbi:MAG: CHRD domain-containing protein [Armatimonadetes bacterium]|nr:CHRD domain-containing protein [Armatimonadota bacterium]
MFVRKMNRRTWLAAAVTMAALTPTLFLAGCGGDDDDDDLILDAILSAANEIPAPQGNPQVTGTTVVTVSEDRSTITVDVNTAGSFTSPVTGAHIHVITNANGTGPVIFPLFNATQQGNWPGQLRRILTQADFTPAGGVETFQQAIDQILNNNTYVNIHTQLNPAGEIRGNLRLRSHHQGETH